MAFAILRMDKLTSFGNAGGLNDHIERTMHVPNADPELTKFNQRLIGTGNLAADIKARHAAVGYGSNNKKVRKNGVLANEFLLTASPEAFPTQKQDGQLVCSAATKNKWENFKNISRHFLEGRYGKENLINFSIHMDEETPHIHAVVVPIVDGKLNSKALFGDRQKLRDLQTDFAKAVACLGLERGVEGSKANHTTIKEYYSAIKISELKAVENLNKVYKEAPIPILAMPPLIGLNRDNWKREQEAVLKKAMTNYLADIVTPMVKGAAQKIVNVDKMEKRMHELEKDNKEAKEAIREIFHSKSFTPEILEKFLPDVANQIKQKQREEIERIAAEKKQAEKAIKSDAAKKAASEKTVIEKPLERKGRRF